MSWNPFDFIPGAMLLFFCTKKQTIGHLWLPSGFLSINTPSLLFGQSGTYGSGFLPHFECFSAIPPTFHSAPWIHTAASPFRNAYISPLKCRQPLQLSKWYISCWNSYLITLFFFWLATFHRIHPGR